jgi:hypothetical protein
MNEEELFGAFAEAEEEDVMVIEDRDAASKVLIDQLKAVRVLRDEKDGLEARVKEINKILDEQEVVILRQFDALGIKNMRVDGVGLVYRSEIVIPTILDNDMMLVWLAEHGENIAKTTVHPQTLKAWYTDRLTNGEELPPLEVVKTFTKREVRFRKK